MAKEGGDPRLVAMSMGFPVSVHPLRISNTRAQFSSGESVIDFKFLRLAGLLHKMTPLREGRDDVRLTATDGTEIRTVYGYIDVTFDAHGYEFEDRFWVIDIAFPVEMQIGQAKLMKKYDCVVEAVEGGDIVIKKFNAKKVRKILDVYVTQWIGIGFWAVPTMSCTIKTGTLFLATVYNNCQKMSKQRSCLHSPRLWIHCKVWRDAFP